MAASRGQARPEGLRLQQPAACCRPSCPRAAACGRSGARRAHDTTRQEARGSSVRATRQQGCSMRQRQRAPACPACEHRQQYYAAAVRPPQRDSMQGACRAQHAWPGTEYVLKRRRMDPLAFISSDRRSIRSLSHGSATSTRDEGSRSRYLKNLWSLPFLRFVPQ